MTLLINIMLGILSTVCKIIGILCLVLMSTIIGAIIGIGMVIASNFCCDAMVCTC